MTDENPFAKYAAAEQNPFAKFASISPGNKETPFSAVNWKIAGAPGVDIARTDGGTLGESPLTQAVHGFNEGLSKYTVGPEKLVSMGVDKLTGDEFPTNRAAWDAAPTPVTDWLQSGAAPTSAGQRFSRRAGETVGTAVPYMGLGMAAAPAMAAADTVAGVPSMAPNAVSRAVGEMGRWAGANPGANAAAELAGATISGSGAGTVAAAAPGHPDWESIAEVVTPILPVALAGTAKRVGNEIATIWGVKTNNEYAQRALSDALGRDLGPEEMAMIENVVDLRKKIPGFNPTLAEALGGHYSFDKSTGQLQYKSAAAPDLLATQKGMESTLEGEERSVARQRYHDNISAVQKFIDMHAPGDDVIPHQVIDSISGKITGLTKPEDDKLAAVGQEQINLGQRAPTTDRMAQGNVIRDREEAIRAEEMQRMGDLHDSLGLNKSGLALPFDELRSTLTSKYGLQRGEDPQNQPAVLAIIANDNNNKISFKDLVSYRTTINKALGKAIFDKNDLMGRKLAGMQHDLDQFIMETAPRQYSLRQGEGGLYGGEEVVLTDPHIGAAQRTFASQYKTDIVDRFKQGAAYRTRLKNGEGFYATTPEKVAEMFWKTPTGAAQFNTTFRGDPEATSALRNVILDDLNQRVVRDGKINQKNLDSWLIKNRQNLSQLPEIQAEVSEIRNVEGALAERAAALEGRKTSITDMLLAKRLDKVKSGDVQPEEIATEALKNPRLMGQVLNTIGADDALRTAWRRLVWNRATVASPQEMESMLDNQAMKLALGPQHVGYLKDIFAASKVARAAGTMPPKDITPELYSGVRNNMGQGIDSLVAKLWAVETGRTGSPWAITNIAGGILRQQRRNAVSRILKQAFYDPQVAKAFADSLRDRSPISAGNLKMRSYLLSIGHEIGDDNQTAGQ